MNHYESLPILYGKVRIIVSSVLLLAVILCPISYHYDIGNHPLSTTGLVIVDAILMILLIYALFSRITIDVGESGIRINGCFIPRSEIVKCECMENVHTYRKFGGIGIRTVPGKRGYTSSKVKSGVVIKRKNGLDIVVSSERPDELMHCIDSLINLES